QNVADYNPAGLATFNIQFHFLNNRVSFGILLPAPVGYKGYDVSYRKSSNHGSVMFMDIVSDRTGTHNPASVREGLETFMRTLFPEEGFTVVPVFSAPGSTSHRVHLVSRKDSRIWGEFRFQTAAMYNIQHN